MTNQVLNDAEKSGLLLPTARKHCEELLTLDKSYPSGPKAP